MNQLVKYSIRETAADCKKIIARRVKLALRYRIKNKPLGVPGLWQKVN